MSSSSSGVIVSIFLILRKSTSVSTLTSSSFACWGQHMPIPYWSASFSIGLRVLLERLKMLFGGSAGSSIFVVSRAWSFACCDVFIACSSEWQLACDIDRRRMTSQCGRPFSKSRVCLSHSSTLLTFSWWTLMSVFRWPRRRRWCWFLSCCGRRQRRKLGIKCLVMHDSVKLRWSFAFSTFR